MVNNKIHLPPSKTRFRFCTVFFLKRLTFLKPTKNVVQLLYFYTRIHELKGKESLFLKHLSSAPHDLAASHNIDYMNMQMILLSLVLFKCRFRPPYLWEAFSIYKKMHSGKVASAIIFQFREFLFCYYHLV